jgi:hypothetical protein
MTEVSLMGTSAVLPALAVGTSPVFLTEIALQQQEKG